MEQYSGSCDFWVEEKKERAENMEARDAQKVYIPFDAKDNLDRADAKQF